MNWAPPFARSSSGLSIPWGMPASFLRLSLSLSKLQRDIEASDLVYNLKQTSFVSIFLLPLLVPEKLGLFLENLFVAVAIVQTSAHSVEQRVAFPTEIGQGLFCESNGQGHQDETQLVDCQVVQLLVVGREAKRLRDHNCGRLLWLILRKARQTHDPCIQEPLVEMVVPLVLHLRGRGPRAMACSDRSEMAVHIDYRLASRGAARPHGEYLCTRIPDGSQQVQINNATTKIEFGSQTQAETWNADHVRIGP